MLGLIEVFFFLFSGYEHNLPRSLGSLKGKSLIRRGFFKFCEIVWNIFFA